LGGEKLPKKQLFLL